MKYLVSARLTTSRLHYCPKACNDYGTDPFLSAQSAIRKTFSSQPQDQGPLALGKNRCRALVSSITSHPRLEYLHNPPKACSVLDSSMRTGRYPKIVGCCTRTHRNLTVTAQHEALNLPIPEETGDLGTVQALVAPRFPDTF